MKLIPCKYISNAPGLSTKNTNRTRFRMSRFYVLFWPWLFRKFRYPPEHSPPVNQMDQSFLLQIDYLQHCCHWLKCQLGAGKTGDQDLVEMKPDSKRLKLVLRHKHTYLWDGQRLIPVRATWGLVFNENGLLVRDWSPEFFEQRKRNIFVLLRQHEWVCDPKGLDQTTIFI